MKVTGNQLLQKVIANILTASSFPRTVATQPQGVPLSLIRPWLLQSAGGLELVLSLESGRQNLTWESPAWWWAWPKCPQHLKGATAWFSRAAHPTAPLCWGGPSSSHIPAPSSCTIRTPEALVVSLISHLGILASPGQSALVHPPSCISSPAPSRRPRGYL